jgi:hypothetical protein
MLFVWHLPKPAKVESRPVDTLDEAASLWHDLGRPECWLFFEVGQAPWHCAAETVRISSQHGKVSS